MIELDGHVRLTEVYRLMTDWMRVQLVNRVADRDLDEDSDIKYPINHLGEVAAKQVIGRMAKQKYGDFYGALPSVPPVKLSGELFREGAGRSYFRIQSSQLIEFKGEKRYRTYGFEEYLFEDFWKDRLLSDFDRWSEKQAIDVGAEEFVQYVKNKRY